jgi:hypothetical protein
VVLRVPGYVGFRGEDEFHFHSVPPKVLPLYHGSVWVTRSPID